MKLDTPKIPSPADNPILFLGLTAAVTFTFRYQPKQGHRNSSKLIELSKHIELPS